VVVCSRGGELSLARSRFWELLSGPGAPHVHASRPWSALLLGGLARAIVPDFRFASWSGGRSVAVGPLTLGDMAMCKRCVVELGWVPQLEADVERYLVDWWPASGKSVRVDSSEWYATKERLSGFGEALMLVGAAELGQAVLSLADLAVDRDLAELGVSATLIGRPASSFYSLYTKPLRAVRF
jgi:hypothetical protein